MKAVFASRNPHKFEQVARLLPGIELLRLDDVAPGIALDEPFDTFEENALAKARTVAAAAGMIALADDSGLEVDGLGGAPGVKSARYAGENATDEQNNLKLVGALESVPEGRRTCRYRCVAVAVWPGGRELVAHGTCAGRVVAEGRGTLGFGYDPHVVPDGETRTMAEIPLDEKLAFSHRGRAFRALLKKMEVARISDLTEGVRIARGIDALDEETVETDPIVLFGRWLASALEYERGEPNAMTLATSTREGRVSARTVLLRGFDDRGFVFYSNYRSRKGRDLAENPQAALIFLWAELQRQVSVTGKVEQLSSEESLRYFRTRPRGHQLAAWASRQSAVIASRAALDADMRRLEETYKDRDVPLPPHWGGYRLVPDAVEFWQGRPDRLHDRLRFRRGGDYDDWVLERLAP